MSIPIRSAILREESSLSSKARNKPKPVLLLIDDEQHLLEGLSTLFEDTYEIRTAESARQARSAFNQTEPHAVILDLGLPDEDGLKLLRAFRKQSPYCQVIVLTADTSVHTGVQCIKAGAWHYVTKPFENDELEMLVARAIEERRLRLSDHLYHGSVSGNRPEIIGRSTAWEQVREKIDKAGRKDVTVLIQGESGTGKELVARMLHAESPRNQSPFTVLNCAAIPQNLIESELFGHEKGAFTGAAERKIGFFELTDSGTLFMDDINYLSTDMQVRFLRVLQERTIVRVGGRQRIPVDVRVISASNRNLDTLVKQGAFRDDLFYRLNILVIDLPPLRERIDDLEDLCNHFIRKYNRKHKTRVRPVNRSILNLFRQYHWPGNVRELENIIQRMMILCDGTRLDTEHVPREIFTPEPTGTEDRFDLPLKDAVCSFEKDYISCLLKKNDYNVRRAAEAAGVHRNTLTNKINEYGIALRRVASQCRADKGKA